MALLTEGYSGIGVGMAQALGPSQLSELTALRILSFLSCSFATSSALRYLSSENRSGRTLTSLNCCCRSRELKMTSNARGKRPGSEALPVTV